MVYRSIMIIPCPLEQSIDESTFFKPWKSLPLLFASNSGLVNSRSYNVWKSSTVFHCHLFFNGIQVFKLFVRGDKQNPIGFKGERTLRGKNDPKCWVKLWASDHDKNYLIYGWNGNKLDHERLPGIILPCDLRVLFSLQWTLSHFGNGILFHSLTLARCLLLVCCLVTTEAKQVDSPLIKCVLMIFVYAFVCFLVIPFSSRNQPTCSVLCCPSPFRCFELRAMKDFWPSWSSTQNWISRWGCLHLCERKLGKSSDCLQVWTSLKSVDLSRL